MKHWFKKIYSRIPDMSIKKINAEQLRAELRSSHDLFICSTSYEDRCKSISNLISDSKIEALICHNPLTQQAEENKVWLTSNFKKHKLAEVFSDRPIESADNISKRLDESDIGSKTKVLIDVTTFTHELLLILLKLISIRNPEWRRVVSYAYTTAKEYSINEKNPNEKWLSKGIGEIRSILGYPGQLSPTRRNHLIVLVGFETERALKLIETYEPDVLSLGLTTVEESVNEAHYAINERRSQHLLSYLPRYEKFNFSCIDPFKTKEELIKQHNLFKDCNLIIAGLNNKLSTLGIGFMALENDEVQLCYATANQYNMNGYSTPGDDFYLISY